MTARRKKGPRGTSHDVTVDTAVQAPDIKKTFGSLPPAALVVIGLVVFSNNIAGPFIWDDQVAIVENATIAPRAGLRDAFRPPAENPMTGRPLANASLALNYRLGGLHPLGYHVWNIFTHIIGAVPVRRCAPHAFARQRERHGIVIVFHVDRGFLRTAVDDPSLTNGDCRLCDSAH
jgi:hypothetical protein